MNMNQTYITFLIGKGAIKMKFENFIEDTPLPEFMDSVAVHKFQMQFDLFVPAEMTFLEVAEANREFVANLSVQ